MTTGTKENERVSRRILIVRLSAFGDIIHTLPALAFLRKMMPASVIDWAVEDKWKEILSIVEGIDNVIPVDSYGWRSKALSPATWSQIGRLRAQLLSNSYDVAIDFQGLIKSAVVTALSEAPIRAGFSREELKERFASIFYTKSYPGSGEKGNVVFKNIKLSRNVASDLRGGKLNDEYDLNSNDRMKKIPPVQFKTDNEIKERLLENFNRRDFTKLCLIHTGSSWQSKKIPDHLQAQICDLINKKLKLNVVLCGSGSDIKTAQTVRDMCKMKKPLIMETSMRELKELILISDIFIGSDSGPLHLAALLGIPVIGIYGPTDPARNGPTGLKTAVVEAPCREKYCWRRTCRYGCMNEIDPFKVIEAAQRLL